MPIKDVKELPDNRPDLWSAITTFRTEIDLNELDIDEILEGVRDLTPSRELEP